MVAWLVWRIHHGIGVIATPEPTTGPTDITRILLEVRQGHREAMDRVLPLVYDELRRIARGRLRGQSMTLGTTELVHEAYLKLADGAQAEWRDRAHFFAVAAIAMRQILVDRARQRCAVKREGYRRRISLDEAVIPSEDQADALLEIDEALNALSRLDERLARVVECRFFGGLTEVETAEALGVTPRTVRRDWVKAKGLLYDALSGS
ncbi:MAG TPA: ECF-type sigma factor [Gemmatimonadota bacterium]|nr:ECF-type sigma factor [Gemmatimonadota bacterium]